MPSYKEGSVIEGAYDPSTIGVGAYAWTAQDTDAIALKNTLITPPINAWSDESFNWIRASVLEDRSLVLTGISFDDDLRIFNNLDTAADDVQQVIYGSFRENDTSAGTQTLRGLTPSARSNLRDIRGYPISFTFYAGTGLHPLISFEGEDNQGTLPTRIRVNAWIGDLISNDTAVRIVDINGDNIIVPQYMTEASQYTDRIASGNFPDWFSYRNGIPNGTILMPRDADIVAGNVFSYMMLIPPFSNWLYPSYGVTSPYRLDSTGFTQTGVLKAQGGLSVEGETVVGTLRTGTVQVPSSLQYTKRFHARVDSSVVTPELRETDDAATVIVRSKHQLLIHIFDRTEAGFEDTPQSLPLNFSQGIVEFPVGGPNRYNITSIEERADEAIKMTLESSEQ